MNPLTIVADVVLWGALGALAILVLAGIGYGGSGVIDDEERD